MQYMSDDPFKDPFVRRITSKDSELRQRIDVARCNLDEEELHILYNEIYHMFLVAEKMPIHPLMKAIFISMADDVKLEVLLFDLRRDFAEQINQITTRNDGIEKEIKAVKERFC
jgi:hypothetical protein